MTVGLVRWDIDPLTVVVGCDDCGQAAVEWALDWSNQTVFATCPGCGGDVLLAAGPEFVPAARLHSDVRAERLADDLERADVSARAEGAQSAFEADYLRLAWSTPRGGAEVSYDPEGAA